MSKGLRVRNTLVNGGMTGIDEKIDKVFAYKPGNNYSTAKRRVKASNPNTEAQQLIRNTFTQTSAGWSALTEEQRNLWNSAAPLWVNTGIFGDKKQTGKNLYTGCNIRLINAGSILINTPRSKDLIAQLQSGSLEVNAGVIELLGDFDVISNANFIQFAVSPQMSAGYSKSPTLTTLNSYDCANDVSDAVTNEYVAKYGALVAGKKIFWEVRLISAGGNSTVMYSGHTLVVL